MTKTLDGDRIEQEKDCDNCLHEELAEDSGKCDSCMLITRIDNWEPKQLKEIL